MIKVISGGQTGADRGGLDAAIALGIEHGGWCPKGRIAEDGRIPVKYQLQEMPTASYNERTKANVIDSEITLIFYQGVLNGGSRYTKDCCLKYNKDKIILNLKDYEGWTYRKIADIIIPALEKQFLIINVAGNRESKAPGIHEAVKQIMHFVLKELRG